MKKIVFFDIDGTIFDANMQIPESTKKAIEELKKEGHLAFLCSGRSRANIHSKSLFEMGFDGIIAACGNHVEMNGEIIHEVILEQDLVKKIIEVTTRCNMPVVLEGPNHHWISEKGFENDPFVTYLWESLQERAVPLNGYEEGIRINKFSADIIEGTDMDTITKEMKPYFDILYHDGDTVEFIPKNTSKATGIEWLCNHLGIAHENTFAVGDSVNDLEMLRYVKTGIAMGNATDIAKEAADYVTTDIHEDGIWNAMVHFGLIKNEI